MLKKNIKVLIFNEIIFHVGGDFGVFFAISMLDCFKLPVPLSSRNDDLSYWFSRHCEQSEAIPKNKPL